MPDNAAQLSLGVCTDIGARRDLNEDAVLVSSPIFAVADGMGGHAAGEIASAIAVKSLSTLSGRVGLRPDDILQAIGEANAAIVEHVHAVADTAGMGTTVSGLCLGTVGETPHWVVFNVGDSRVYRYADGQLRQITIDHSEIAELIAGNRITAEEALTHPLRNVVTRSLGMIPAPAPDIWVLPVLPAERFLICSDGLSLEVTHDAIAAALDASTPAQNTAELLVQQALQAGGRDNISVIVIDVTTQAETGDCDDVTSPRPRLQELA